MLNDENEIHRLNLKIKEMEENIYDRKENEIRMRRTKELVILQLTIALEEKYLETKDKRLSNAEKRTIEAEKNPEISQLMIDIEIYKRTTAIIEIELNYNKRLFQIEMNKLEAV
jgi:activator of HSP90 ATPase